MDDALRFIQQFVEAEHQALVSQHADPDDQAYARTKAAVEEHLADDVRSGLDRPPSSDTEWFERGRRKVERGEIVRRTIFQIKRYQNAQLGDIFRAYLSSTERPGTGRADYFTNAIIGDVNGHLKVIARYDLDLLPQPGDRIVDARLGWIRHSGAHLDAFGALTEVRKLEPPGAVAQRAEYEAE